MMQPWSRFAKDKPFKKVKVPKDLYVEMMLAYNDARFNEIQFDPYFDDDYNMIVSGGSVSVLNTKRPFYLRAQLAKDLFDRWGQALQPQMEEWCGQELRFVQGYGIRSYIKDSILAVHRDEITTHVISAIIHIDEYPSVKWPLDFIDHEGEHHKVTFDSGDMLMYESLCVHARSTPFQGEFYRNMYFHWCPKVWDSFPYVSHKLRYKSIEEAQNEYKH